MKFFKASDLLFVLVILSIFVSVFSKVKSKSKNHLKSQVSLKIFTFQSQKKKKTKNVSCLCTFNDAVKKLHYVNYKTLKNENVCKLKEHIVTNFEYTDKSNTCTCKFPENNPMTELIKLQTMSYTSITKDNCKAHCANFIECVAGSS